MKPLYSFCLFVLFTIQFSGSAFGLVWVNSVVENTPPSTDCVPSSVNVAGDLSATHTFMGASVNVVGSNITISINYSSGIGLPVITPFNHTVDLGLLPANSYTITTLGVLDGTTQSTFTSTLNVTACCGTSADFIAPISVCIGEIFELVNTSTGSISQEWYEDGTGVGSTINHIVNAGSAGSFVYKLVTSDGSCQDSIEYTVNVLDLPTVTTLTPNQTALCQGESLTITSTTMNASGFAWTDNGLPSGTSSTLITTVSTPGTHLFELIATNGACSDSMETTITVYTAPTIDSFSPAQTSICLGESVDITSTSTGGTVIEWYENGFVVGTGNNLSITPTSPGNYTYQLLVENTNCSDFEEVVITVAANPTIDNFSASHTVLCLGDTVDFTSTTSNATSLEWFENGNSVGNGNDLSIVPNPEGVYTYQLFAANGNCYDSTEYTLDVVGIPTVDLGPDTTDCFGAIIILDAGAGMTSYMWQDQSTNQTFTPTTTGTYSVTVTDANGCTNFDEVYVESCASISEENGLNVVLYPNPTATSTRIDLEGYEGNLEISITDANGKLISKLSEYIFGTMDLDLNELNSGIYYVELTTVNGNAIIKFIKE